VASRNADLIRLLEAELDLIEAGGYAPHAGRPLEERPVFSHSIICIEHWLCPDRKPGCGDDCILMDWVPEERKHSASMPCHFIPLNAAGETANALEGNPERLEAAVKGWLRTTIKRLREERESEVDSPAVTY
jgi:hypothetical protein